MKRLCLVLLYLVVMLQSTMAQNLKVKSFSLAINDLSASVDTVPDENGEPCALVKILVVDSIAKVEGFVLKTENAGPTEKWVYLSKGTKEMRLKPTHYKPIHIYFPDYGIDGVEGKKTYILDLEAPHLESATLPVSLSNFSANQMMSLHSYESTPSGNVITIPVKDGISIEMVKVEAGSFTMGATPEMGDAYDNEKPTHKVILTNNYYLGRCEVTQALWNAIMGSNPSRFLGAELPVEQVSWDDCHRFIDKLNSMTGLHFRLPTEAEWEFAARGGNKSCAYKYSGSNVLSDVAWYKDNSGGRTHPVGALKPNELGLYDMSGNVNEWCQDKFDKYQGSVQTNPIGPGPFTGIQQVGKGGSWAS